MFADGVAASGARLAECKCAGAGRQRRASPIDATPPFAEAMVAPRRRSVGLRRARRRRGRRVGDGTARAPRPYPHRRASAYGTARRPGTYLQFIFIRNKMLLTSFSRIEFHAFFSRFVYFNLRRGCGGGIYYEMKCTRRQTGGHTTQLTRQHLKRFMSRSSNARNYVQRRVTRR